MDNKTACGDIVTWKLLLTKNLMQIFYITKLK